MMRICPVTNITWSGGPLTTYAVLDDGPLVENSIVAAPSLYLIFLAKEGKSLRSLKAAADDMKAFFQTLRDHNQDWRMLTDRDMSGYLYGHLKVEKKLCDKTIDRHISTIRGLYRFGRNSGLLPKPKKYTYNYTKNNLKRQGEGHKKVNFNLFNKYVEASIFECLLTGVNAASAFIIERDELVITLGYLCGLRTSEVTDPRNLNTLDLKDRFLIADKADELSITIPIIGKGDKLRHVDIPPKAALKTRSFLNGRRSKLDDGPLICSEKGFSMRSSHATDIFRKAKESVSYLIPELLENSRDEKPHLHFITAESFNSLSFHCLRHTYATNLVDFCYAHGIDPNQYVPEQMGHEDFETTKAYIIFDGQLRRREKVRRALNDEHH
jgi:site-specific recombinase XerD